VPVPDLRTCVRTGRSAAWLFLVQPSDPREARHHFLASAMRPQKRKAFNGREGRIGQANKRHARGDRWWCRPPRTQPHAVPASACVGPASARGKNTCRGCRLAVASPWLAVKPIAFASHARRARGDHSQGQGYHWRGPTQQ
jgi:hypothetical protein